MLGINTHFKLISHINKRVNLKYVLMRSIKTDLLKIANINASFKFFLTGNLPDRQSNFRSFSFLHFRKWSKRNQVF